MEECTKTIIANMLLKNKKVKKLSIEQLKKFQKDQNLYRYHLSFSFVILSANKKCNKPKVDRLLLHHFLKIDQR